MPPILKPAQRIRFRDETVRSNLQGLNRFQGYMAGKLAKLGFQAE